MAKSKSLVATTNRQYATALSRAFAGAIIFSLPLLMTMEMWWLGHYLRPEILLQFSLVQMVVLYGLSKVAGFEESHNRVDDVLDAFAAYGVAGLTSTAALLLFGVIGPSTPIHEAAGKIAIQSVPASFGAMIGAKLMGEGEAIEKQERWRDTYGGRLFLALAGALFLSFTVAPTEEILLIAFQMSWWHGLVLVLLSVLLLHAIVYLVGFPRQDLRSERSHGFALLRHTLPGYAIAVIASTYILATFGRIAGLDIGPMAMAVAVLAFPASIGAAIARIVV